MSAKPKARKRPAPSGRTARSPERAAAAPPDALAKVRAAISRVRPQLSPRKIVPRASLVADLGIDSLAFAELSVALEDEFDRPVFIGDVLADIEDPGTITVAQLAQHLARGE